MSTTTKASVTNQEHADRLLGEAVTAAQHRRALLTASAALGSTSTVAAALRALAEWNGPAEIRTGAIGILDALSKATP